MTDTGPVGASFQRFQVCLSQGTELALPSPAGGPSGPCGQELSVQEGSLCPGASEWGCRGGPPDPAVPLGARTHSGMQRLPAASCLYNLGFGLLIGSVFSEKKEHLLSTYNQEKNRAEGRHYAVSPGRMNHGLPPLLCILSFLKGFKSSLMHGMVSPCQ